MTIFDGLLGNATQVELADVQREYARILATGERIERAYKLIRDMFIFTDKRLILVDKQGMTGKKTQYHSIPYKTSPITPWKRQVISIWMRSCVCMYRAVACR